jgi:hypothetical protein
VRTEPSFGKPFTTFDAIESLAEDAAVAARPLEAAEKASTPDIVPIRGGNQSARHHSGNTMNDST